MSLYYRRPIKVCYTDESGSQRTVIGLDVSFVPATGVMSFRFQLDDGYHYRQDTGAFTVVSVQPQNLVSIEAFSGNAQDLIDINNQHRDLIEQAIPVERSPRTRTTTSRANTANAANGDFTPNRRAVVTTPSGASYEVRIISATDNLVEVDNLSMPGSTPMYLDRHGLVWSFH